MKPFLLFLFGSLSSVFAQKMETCRNVHVETGGFPIDRIYPSAAIQIREGKALFSRASKAFILWRSKTPLHIPDSVFISHYLKVREQVPLYYRVPAVSLVPLPQSPATSVALPKNALKDCPTEVTWTIGEVLREAVDYQSGVDPMAKVIFFVFRGELFLVSWPYPLHGQDIHHDEIWSLLEPKLPEAKLISTGTLNVEYSASGNGHPKMGIKYYENFGARIHERNIIELMKAEASSEFRGEFSEQGLRVEIEFEGVYMDNERSSGFTHTTGSE